VPPLRERREDIPVLVEQFLRASVQQYGTEPPELTPEAMACLVENDWPGNVRELKNVIERCVVRSRGRVITPNELPSEVRFIPSPPSTQKEAPRPSLANASFDRMVKGGESFWSVVYAPFMSRDLTRDHVRKIVTLGLQRATGSYRLLLQLFNMKPEDYKRFLSFLSKYQCRVPFQPFRVISKSDQVEEDPSEAPDYAPARTAG
jgi:DNA-binding NtrC family response regulator